MNKRILIIGITTYSILGILAFVFFMERSVFLDMSFRLFHILKEKTFAIQVYRYGSFLTQSIPLLGIWLGLTLKQIAQLYSVGFVLFHFVVFLLCTGWLRSYRFGLIMLLHSTLLTSHTFYWIQSEYLQGMVMLILFFGILVTKLQTAFSNNRLKLLVYCTLLIFTFLLAFFHPLMIFPFSFALLFFMLEQNISKKLLIITGLFFVLFYLIKFLFFKSGYDSGAMGGLKNFIHLFPDYFFIQSNKNFVYYVISDYWYLPIFSLLIFGHYLLKKNYKKLTLFTVFTAGYFFIIQISYYENAQQFYLESFYIAFGIFLLFPLVFDLIKSISRTKIMLGLTFILVTRLVNIYASHNPYSSRTDYLQELVTQSNSLSNKKLIIDEKNVPMDKLLMSWGTPYECWLISQMKNGISRSIIVSNNPAVTKKREKSSTTFLTTWREYDYHTFPKKYFNFQDTSSYIIYNPDIK